MLVIRMCTCDTYASVYKFHTNNRSVQPRNLYTVSPTLYSKKGKTVQLFSYIQLILINFSQFGGILPTFSKIAQIYIFILSNSNYILIQFTQRIHIFFFHSFHIANIFFMKTLKLHIFFGFQHTVSGSGGTQCVMVLVLVDNQTLLTTKQSDNNSNSNAAVKEFFEF